LNPFNLLTLPLFNPIALHHLGERSRSVVTVPLQNQGLISKGGAEILVESKAAKESPAISKAPGYEMQEQARKRRINQQGRRGGQGNPCPRLGSLDAALGRQAKL
jgi:hypothetical protein